MNGDLARKLIGVDWNFSQNIRDNVLESLSGVKGENSVKIIGPDLNAAEVHGRACCPSGSGAGSAGIKNVGVFHIMGQSNLTLPIDRDKCAHWNVTAQGVQNVIQTAVGGLACTQMIEGEKNFDVTLRWPQRAARQYGRDPRHSGRRRCQHRRDRSRATFFLRTTRPAAAPPGPRPPVPASRCLR